jgi:hypothetical protein
VGVVALVGAAIVAGATPASANTCATATPMGTPPEMGTVSRNGSVSGLPGDQQEWWEHVTGLNNRSVTVAAPFGGAVNVSVYDQNCGTVALCGPVASPGGCTFPTSMLPPGPLKILVEWSPISTNPSVAVAYTLTATGLTAAECSDGMDNDSDGASDFGSDNNCTSATDNTEAPVHVAAYGHITITKASATATPTMGLSGVYASSIFQCTPSFTTTEVKVSCDQQFDPEYEYDCSAFILTATAPAPSAASGATGDVHGYVGCPVTSIQTADVVGSGTQSAYGSNMGIADPVVCQAFGVNGQAMPSGSFQVDCYEPGVAWPYGTRPI